MHADPNDTEDPGLPCVAGLIAATMGLMTTWAAPAPDATMDAHQQRRLIARKIVSNLFFLSHHPNAVPDLQLVMKRLHQHWVAIAHEAQPAASDMSAMPSAAAVVPPPSSRWH